MNDSATTPSSKVPDRAEALTFGKALDILWDCAWSALVLTFLVQIFGAIAFGLVSGLWSHMTPSLPPGIAGKQAAETAWDFRFFHQHQFALIFGMLFAAKAAGQLTTYSRRTEHRDIASRLTRICRGISEQWFSLVVTNAFIAFGAVIAIQWTQRFSFTHWFWHVAFDLFRPLIDAIAGVFPDGFTGAIKSLTAWYGDNQFKFTFWLLYSAAICDDLGLPNYKALVRVLWRRFGTGRKTGGAKMSSPAD